MERVLTDFVKTLRNANVKVSPAETLDAMAVIEKVGYDNKELLKNTLSLALPKTSYEKEKFEVCFDLFLTNSLLNWKIIKRNFNPPFRNNRLILNLLNSYFKMIMMRYNYLFQKQERRRRLVRLNTLRRDQFSQEEF